MFVAGDKIGAYVVKSRLGAGGMGEVYLAEHVHIGRQAAIKVLLPELAARPDVVARFFNEARATGLLRHPNIVEVLDCDVLASGHAYIVMELLGGESLSACLSRVGNFAAAWPTALAITGQIASALSAAHARGIVHRDLKPDNIYLVATQQPEAPIDVKVLDFGIAKLLGDSEGSMTRTRTGSLLGTPVYMSPEQCRGAGMVDHRADIYSLGCILFEMLAGQPPFIRAGAGELIAAHMFQPAPPLSSLAPSIPTEIEELVARMLAKLPGQRPQTMADVIAAIEPGLNLPPSRFREAIAVPPGFPFPRDDSPALITSQPGSLTPSSRGSASTELAAPASQGSARPGTLVMNDAGAPGQSRTADGDDAPIDEAVRHAVAEAKTFSATSRWTWIVSSLATLAVAGGALYWTQSRVPKLPAPAERPPTRPTNPKPAEVTIDRAPLDELLQAKTEPPWPAACTTSEPALVERLVNAAQAFAPGAPSQSRARRLAALAALPETGG